MRLRRRRNHKDVVAALAYVNETYANRLPLMESRHVPTNWAKPKEA